MLQTLIAVRTIIHVPLILLVAAVGWTASGPVTAMADDPRNAEKQGEYAQQYKREIQPLLEQYCVDCHNVDEMTSGIRLDHLTGDVPEKSIYLWKDVLRQVEGETMPPEDESQPTTEQRKAISDWIRTAVRAAQSRAPRIDGSIRRLTVAQYRNALRDLLGLEDDFTDILPADGVSKDGFLNNRDTLLLSPLLVEAYFEIAEKALDRCIVDVESKPTVQNFRMQLGANINPEPCPDRLILGANSHLLANQDFVVTQPVPEKPFAFEPLAMRTKFRFHEGYQGNATVRGWREYDSIYHAVFACLRGTNGYPKGRAYETIPSGLLLRPAIPSSEIFKQSSTYGPKANFKISLRELPRHGRFQVRVRARRYNDALLLDKNSSTQPADAATSLTVDKPSASSSNPSTFTVKQAGVYQLDVHYIPRQKPELLSLQLGDRHFSGQLPPRKTEDEFASAFLVVRLPAGPQTLHAKYADNRRLRRLVFTPLAADSELAQQFATFEHREPILGVHLGLRRDCGSTFSRVGSPTPIDSGELREYVFEGAINNFPSPDGDADNDNYLADVREIGVRSEYTDGRDMPRLLIHSVEFEGPYHESWPPRSHRAIFLSKPTDDPTEYARAVIRSFASRAYRRPLTDAEESSLMDVWAASQADGVAFNQSIKDALLVALTSPQFLFLIERSQTPEPEPLGPYELASKLSFFLWNTSPDERLLERAANGTLRDSLDEEVTRMVGDPRFRQFTHPFVSQWLNLDKLDVLEVDQRRFPDLTRDAKLHLRDEPIEFVEHLMRHNLPVKNLIEADFVIANEVVATFYGLGSKTESGFDYVPIQHQADHLGGLLTQAGLLAGLSDGREPNPVKRGAWLARKIIAEPPADPPPNVPSLEEDTSHLPLRERLEKHRNQPGCAKCHSGIDPWGIPLEQYNASGRFQSKAKDETVSALPDGTEVAGVRELKRYLAKDRLDQVAFSVLKHLTCYAIGRSLGYNEIEFLRQEGLESFSGQYRMQDMLRFVVKSKLFLEK